MHIYMQINVQILQTYTHVCCDAVKAVSNSFTCPSPLQGVRQEFGDGTWFPFLHEVLGPSVDVVSSALVWKGLVPATNCTLRPVSSGGRIGEA